MKEIPTRTECLRLMTEHKMLENIVAHSVEVARVALFLSQELNRRGQQIDLALVEAASLLHDLTKTECLQTKEDHAATGGKLLSALGYERVARVVSQHIVLCPEDTSAAVSEEEVVNYADKRVQHDRVVSLAERFSDLIARYGKDGRVSARWERLMKETVAIEEKIFLILSMDPSILDQLPPQGKPEGIGEQDK